MKSNPRVSVCMITYGHEAFIAQAINGVFIQETNFDIELIIANDCSPDATDSVVQSILETHPKAHIIKYTKHSKNIGIMPNFIFALSQCKGDFVALCEGDDYWTDPFKLQKQVDFFELNPDFIIHSGNAKILSTCLSNNQLQVKSLDDKIFTLKDFYVKNNIVSCTVMFKNFNFSIPSFFNSLTFGDWFFYIILMYQSKMKVYRSSEVLSVYRIHSGGITSQLTTEKKNLDRIRHLKLIQKYLGYRIYSYEVQDALNYYYFNAFLTKYNDSNYSVAFKILTENLITCTRAFQYRSYLGFFKLTFIRYFKNVKIN
jgi:glycosyltransferase involved in cell wall biosynthesis